MYNIKYGHLGVVQKHPHVTYFGGEVEKAFYKLIAKYDLIKAAIRNKKSFILS